MVRRCYLSQHGLALKSQDDATRPLSAQGREDITRVAGFLSLFTQPRPAIIYSSNKLRAQQSAMMFAEAWQVASPVSDSNLAPNSDPNSMVQRLQSASDDVMLVGHLPYLTVLSSHLLLGHGNGSPVLFANGGVICLQRNDDAWQTCWQVNPTMFYPTD
ncbi:MAG: phosphohistidine phosphatase SixA [Mariprofundales bacterium]